MQHVSSFDSVSPAARKAVALGAYNAAVMAPGDADWQSVAHLLRAAVTVPGARPAGAETTPRWWADWTLGKVYSLDSLTVRFADGREIRVNLAKAPGKLPRIASACRVAVAFYRASTGRDAVPAFVNLECLSDGATFDADACSRLTADQRRTAHVPAAARPPVTADRVAWMEREVERRRAGLAVAEADHAALLNAQASRPVPKDDDAAWHQETNDRLAREASERRVAMWQTAAAAGADEIAAMIEPLDDAATEAGAGLLADDAAQEAVLIPAATIVSPDLNVGPVEATAATEPENPADLSTASAPADTHPITAVCTSHRGREKLLAAVQDGCFPDHTREAYHGVYRITLQDAEEIGAIRGVRYVGMPRKGRSEPVERIEAPAAISLPPFACRALARVLRNGASFPAPVNLH